MARRFTISGLEHMIQLISANSALLALASLAPLQHVAAKAKAASASCGCNATKVYADHRGQFEAALGNLRNGDHITLKRVLNIDELCFYTRINGQQKLTCI